MLLRVLTTALRSTAGSMNALLQQHCTARLVSCYAHHNPDAQLLLAAQLEDGRSADAPPLCALALRSLLDACDGTVDGTSPQAAWLGCHVLCATLRDNADVKLLLLELC